ncbi:hypothetical protein H9P43_008158 [Blastocladiella emersonii ATCC 22665]|nr:hypothetical protein H9P43_008158 [Blastocladiella emersonii ATCC 22665]
MTNKRKGSNGASAATKPRSAAAPAGRPASAPGAGAAAAGLSKEDIRLQANLNVLRRKDPLVTHIVDSTPQVVLYCYENARWNKVGTEGTMFLFARSAAPSHGLFIMNRLSTTNYTLPLTRDLAFKVNGGYLLFQNSDAQIMGLWFYEDKDRERFHGLVTDLCQKETTDSATLRKLEEEQAQAQALPAGRDDGDKSAFLATAQNDLMGLLKRVQQSSSSSVESTTPTPSAAAAPAVDGDLGRLLGKLSVDAPAAPAPAPAPLSSPSSLASASSTAPDAPPTAPAAPAPAVVDPMRLATAAFPLAGSALPPGLPSRDAVRDALVFRVTHDPHFLDALYAAYLAHLTAGSPAMGMIPPPGAMPGAMSGAVPGFVPPGAAAGFGGMFPPPHAHGGMFPAPGVVPPPFSMPMAPPPGPIPGMVGPPGRRGLPPPPQMRMGMMPPPST